MEENIVTGADDKNPPKKRSAQDIALESFKNINKIPDDYTPGVATNLDLEKTSSNLGIANRPGLGLNYITEKNNQAEAQKAYNIEAKAADEQGFFGEMMGSLAQAAVGEILGGAIEGIGYLVDPTQLREMEEGGQSFGKMISDAGKALREGTEELMPIHVNPETQGEFKPWKSEWWFSGIPSVASFASILLPVAGEAKLLALLGEGLSTLNKLGKVSTLGKETKFLGKVLDKTADILKQAPTSALHRTVVSTHIEAMMEASQTFEEELKKLTDSGMDESEARKLAGKSASFVYKANYANLATEFIQQKFLLRGPQLAKQVDGAKMAKAAGLNPNIGRFNAAKDLFKVGASEAFEEAYQFGIQEEGKYLADVKAGLVEEKDFTERLKEYSKNAELWNSAFFGALGGAAMSAIGPKMNETIQKNVLKNTSEKWLSEKEARINDLNSQKERIMQSVSAYSKAVKTGNEDAINAAKSKMSFDLGVSAAKNGNLQFMMERFNNLKNLTPEEKQQLEIEDNTPLMVDDIKKDIYKAAELWKDNTMRYGEEFAESISYREFHLDKLNSQLPDVKQRYDNLIMKLPRYNEISVEGKHTIENKIAVEGLNRAIESLNWRIENQEMPAHEKAKLKALSDLKTADLVQAKVNLSAQMITNKDAFNDADRLILKTLDGKQGEDLAKLKSLNNLYNFQINNYTDELNYLTSKEGQKIEKEKAAAATEAYIKSKKDASLQHDIDEQEMQDSVGETSSAISEQELDEAIQTGKYSENELSPELKERLKTYREGKAANLENTNLTQEDLSETSLENSSNLEDIINKRNKQEENKIVSASATTEYETPANPEDELQFFGIDDTDLDVNLTKVNALAWFSFNNKRAIDSDKTPKNKAISDFLESNYDLSKVELRFNIDFDTLNNTPLKEYPEIQNALKNKTVPKNIGKLPITAALYENGKQIEYEGHKIEVHLHDNDFANYDPTIAEAASREITEQKTQILQALYAGKTLKTNITNKSNGHINTQIEKGGKMSKFPLTDLFANYQDIQFSYGSNDMFLDPKTKSTDLDIMSYKVTNGAIYAKVTTANGNTFPLRLNANNLNNQEAELIYSLYSDILIDNSKYSQNISKELIDYITNSEDASIKQLETYLNLNNTTYQQLLDNLVYNGFSKTKDKKESRLYAIKEGLTKEGLKTPAKVFFGNAYLEQSLFLTEEGKDRFIKSLTQNRRRQIDVKLLNEPEYKKYLVTNNKLVSNAKPNDKGRIFAQPTLTYNPVFEEITEKSVTDIHKNVTKEDIERRRQDVREAIQKAGKGEGGQFIVTLIDGSKENAVRISLVGNELGVGNKGVSVDLSIIKKVENPDGTILYDAELKALEQQHTTSNKSEIEAQKADIEKRARVADIITAQLELGVELPKILETLAEQGYVEKINNSAFFKQSVGRDAIVFNIDGAIVPVYRSSKGTSSKTEGEWYPFFFNGGDWLVKAGADTYKDGYNNPIIKQILDVLNKNYKYDKPLAQTEGNNEELLALLPLGGLDLDVSIKNNSGIYDFQNYIAIAIILKDWQSKLGNIDVSGYQDYLDGASRSLIKTNPTLKSEIEKAFKIPSDIFAELAALNNQTTPQQKQQAQQSNTTVKDGVSEVFDSNPELAKIGNKQQYSQYLDTIFPDSKVKDIVYRGDKSKTINGVTQFLNNNRFRGTQKEPLFLSTKKEVALNQRYHSDYSEFIYLKDDKGNLGNNFDPGSSIRVAVNYLYLKNNNNVNKYGENISEESIDYRIAKAAYDKLSEKGKEIIKNLDFSKEKNKNEFPYTIKTKKDLDKYEGVFKGQLEFGNKNFVKALVNISSPKIFNADNKRYNEYQYGKYGEESLVTDLIKDDSVDSLIIKNVIEEGNILSNTIAIKNPEQIHILGSKQDIEGFKDFVNKPKIINSPITPQQKQEAKENNIEAKKAEIERRIQEELKNEIWNNSGTKFIGKSFVAKDGNTYTIEESELKSGDKVIKVKDKNGKTVSSAYFTKNENGTYSIKRGTRVESQIQSIGLASAIYNYFDNNIGKIKRTDTTTDEGDNLWNSNKNRINAKEKSVTNTQRNVTNNIGLNNLKELAQINALGLPFNISNPLIKNKKYVRVVRDNSKNVNTVEIVTGTGDQYDYRFMSGYTGTGSTQSSDVKIASFIDSNGNLIEKMSPERLGSIYEIPNINNKQELSEILINNAPASKTPLSPLGFKNQNDNNNTYTFKYYDLEFNIKEITLKQKLGKSPKSILQEFLKEEYKKELNNTKTTSSIPLTITSQVRQQLYDLGYSKTDVDNMKPEEGQSIINKQSVKIKEAHVLESIDTEEVAAESNSFDLESLLNKTSPIEPIIEETKVEIPKDDNLSYLDKLKKQINETSEDSDSAFRFLSNDAIYSPKDVFNKEVEHIQSLLPSAIAVNIQNDYIKVLGNGEVAIGIFKDNMISLTNLAPVGTAYHEAFHAVFRTMLGTKELNNTYKEANSYYHIPRKEELNKIKSTHKVDDTEASKIWLEEQLADDFSAYMLNPESSVFTYPKGIKGLFERLKDWIKHVFSNKLTVKKLFNDIQKGKYANKTPKFSRDIRYRTLIQLPKTGDTFTPEEIQEITQQLAFVALNKISNINELKHIDVSKIEKELFNVIKNADKRGDVETQLRAAKVHKNLSHFVYEVQNYIGLIGLEETDEKTEDENGNVIVKSSYEVSGKQNATKNIKFLVGLTPKFKTYNVVTKEKIYDTEGTYLGLPKFANASSTWNKLEKHLSGIVPVMQNGVLRDSFEIMIDKLTELSKYHVELGYVRNQLLNSDTQTQTEFHTTFSRYKGNYVDSLVSGVPGSMTFKTTSSDSFSKEKSIANLWAYNFRNNFGKYEGRKLVYDPIKLEAFKQKYIALRSSLNKDKTINKQISNTTLGLLDSTLNDLGIKISASGLYKWLEEQPVNEKVTDENTIFINKVDAFILKLDKALVGSKESSSLFPIKDNNGRTGPIYDSNNHLLGEKFFTEELASQEAEFQTISGESTVIGPGGNKIWMYQDNNLMSKTIAAVQSGDTTHIDNVLSSVYGTNSKWAKWLKTNPQEFSISLYGNYKQEEVSDKGDKSNDLKDPDKFNDQINKYLKGIYIGLAEADKSQQYYIQGPKLENAQIAGAPDGQIFYENLNANSVNIIYNYFADEVNRMISAYKQINGAEALAPEKQVMYYHYGKVPGDGKGNWNKSYLFPNMDLEKYGITKGGIPIPLALDNKDVKKYISDVFMNLVKQDLAKATEYGILEKKGNVYTNRTLDSGLINGPKYEGNVVKAIADYTLNSIIANVEFTKLFTNDPALYKFKGDGFEDFRKRIPLIIASGKDMRIFKDANYEVRSHYTSATIDNIISPSTYFTSNDNLKLISKATNMSLDKVKNLFKSYGEVNQTDAQAWITIDTYKERMLGFGKWSPSHEESFKKIKAGSTLEADVKLFAQPLKTVHTESMMHNGVLITQYNKQSEAVLLPSFAKTIELGNILKAMEAQKIDHVITLDGKKVGAMGVTKVIDEKGKILDSKDIKLNATILSNKNLFLQQDLPTKRIKDMQVGSQHVKNVLAMLDLEHQYDDITGLELYSQYNETISKLSDLGLLKLRKDLGFNNENKLQEPKAFYKKLYKTFNGTVSRNILQGINNHVPLDALPQLRRQIQNKLNAMVTKDTVKLKQLGGAMIQMSNFGYVAGEVDLNSKVKDGIIWLKNPTEELQPARLVSKKDDNVVFKAAQILMPHSKLVELLTTIGKDYKDLTHNEIKALIDPEVLKGLSYRIPNQGPPSNDVFEIVGILPPEMGDTMVAFKEITTKTGSDFDIDKSFLILPNFKLEGNKIVKVGEDTTKEGLQNRRFNLTVKMMSNPEKYAQLMSPLDAPWLKDLSDKYYPEDKKAKDLFFFTGTNQLQTKSLFDNAKNLVGVIAKHMSHHNLIKHEGMFFNNYYIGKGPKRTETVEVQNEPQEIEPIETLPKLTFNKEQTEAIKNIQDFLDSDKKSMYLLEGKAGTGKTTIIAEALRKKAKTNNIVVAALSHKAKGVVAESFMKNGVKIGSAESLASLLGMKMDLETGKFSKALDNNNWAQEIPIETADILVIDEASMLNEEALKLIEELKNPTTKVIFLADIGQLPPIREQNDSNAGKNSPIFDLKDKSKLVERVRQGELSPILPFADNYWNNSQSKKPVTNPIDDSSRISKFTTEGNLIFTNSKDIIEASLVEFKKSVEEKNPNIIKFVAYTNKVKEKINTEIHKKLFPGGKEYNKGEILIFSDNYKKFTNSDEVQVIDEESIKIDIGNTPLNGYNLLVPIIDDYGRPSETTIKVISKEDKDNYNKIISKLFTTAANLPKGKERSLAYKYAWEQKGKVASIDYAYAITSHKSQGSTYNTVIVIEDDIMNVTPTTNKEKSQSMYTAITRSSDNAVIISSKNKNEENLDLSFRKTKKEVNKNNNFIEIGKKVNIVSSRNDYNPYAEEVKDYKQNITIGKKTGDLVTLIDFKGNEHSFLINPNSNQVILQKANYSNSFSELSTATNISLEPLESAPKINNTSTTKTVSKNQSLLAVEKDEDGNSVEESLIAYANAIVDAAKDPFISRANINQFTASTAFMLIRSGVDREWVTTFMGQPILKALVEETNKSEGRISEKQRDDKGNIVTALDKILLKYGYTAGNSKTFKSNLEAEGLRNPTTGNIEISNSTLVNNLTSNAPSNQLRILAQFLEWQMKSKELSSLMAATSSDTTGATKNQTSATLFVNLVNKVIKDNTFGNLNTMMGYTMQNGQPVFNGNKMIGSYYKNAILASKDMFKDSFLTETPAFNLSLFNVATNAGYRFLQDEELADIINNELYAALVSKSKIAFEDKNDIKKLVYNQSAQINWGDTKHTDVSLANQIVNAKNLDIFKDNNLIQSLDVKFGYTKNDPDTIALSPKNLDIDAKNNLYLDWEQILELDVKLGENLIKYAYYSSGFKTNWGVFFEHIPVDWLEKNGFNKFIKDQFVELANPLALNESESQIFKHLYKNNKLVPTVNNTVLKPVKINGNIVSNEHVIALESTENPELRIGTNKNNSSEYKRFVKRIIKVPNPTQFDPDNSITVTYLYQLSGYQILDANDNKTLVYVRTNTLGYNSGTNIIKEYGGDGNISIFEENNVTLPQEVVDYVSNLHAYPETAVTEFNEDLIKNNIIKSNEELNDDMFYCKYR